MKSLKRQIGGMYSTGFLIACICGAALLGLTVFPIYANEGKLAKIVGQTAASSQNYDAPLASLRSSMQRRWDVDDVKHVTPKDVKLVKNKDGKSLAYKYEVRAHLFANWELVLTFDKSYPMARGGG